MHATTVLLTRPPARSSPPSTRSYGSLPHYISRTRSSSILPSQPCAKSICRNSLSSSLTSSMVEEGSKEAIVIKIVQIRTITITIIMATPTSTLTTIIQLKATTITTVSFPNPNPWAPVLHCSSWRASNRKRASVCVCWVICCHTNDYGLVSLQVCFRFLPRSWLHSKRSLMILMRRCALFLRFLAYYWNSTTRCWPHMQKRSFQRFRCSSLRAIATASSSHDYCRKTTALSSRLLLGRSCLPKTMNYSTPSSTSWGAIYVRTSPEGKMLTCSCVLYAAQCYAVINAPSQRRALTAICSSMHSIVMQGRHSIWT